MFGAVNQGDAGKVAQLLGDGLHADIQQADVRIIIIIDTSTKYMTNNIF